MPQPQRGAGVRRWVRSTRMRATLGLAFLALLLASYGAGSNDEMDQAVAMHNLAQGSWEVEEFPRQIYMVPYLDGTAVLNIRNPAPYPIGSSMLNFLALPATFMAHGIGAVLPLGFVAAAVAVGLGWSALGGPAPWLGDRRGKALRVAGLLGAFVVATWGFGVMPGAGQSPDLPYQRAYIGLQATNLVLYALTCWLLWPLLRRRTTTDRGALVFLLAVVLGPLMVWGESAKYHTLSALLVVIALRLLDTPQTRWTTIGLGTAVGLGIWNQIGVGSVMLVALAFAQVREAWLFRHQLAELGRRWLGLLVGVALGMVPYLIENQLFFGSPWLPFYFAEGAAVTGEPSSYAVGPRSMQASLVLLPAAVLGRAVDVVRRIIGWKGPLDFLDNLATGYVWGEAEGYPTPVLWLSPLLAGFVVFELRWARRRQRLDGASAYAAALVLAQLLLLTNFAPKQGFGSDMRLYAHLLPALGLLAVAAWGPAVSTAMRPLRHPWRATAVLVSVLLGVTAVLSTAFQEGSQDPRQHVRTLHMAYAGVLLGGLLFLVAMRRIDWVHTPMHKLVAALIVLSLALPALWTVTFLLTQPSAVAQEERNEFAVMLLPGMQPVTEAAQDLLLIDAATDFEPPQREPEPAPETGPSGASGNETTPG